MKAEVDLHKGSGLFLLLLANSTPCFLGARLSGRQHWVKRVPSIGRRFCDLTLFCCHSTTVVFPPYRYLGRYTTYGSQQPPLPHP